MLTELPLTGLELQIFVFINQNNRDCFKGKIKRSFISQGVRVDSSIETLIKKNYISFNESTKSYVPTGIGFKFYEEYNKIGNQYIFEHELDYAIIYFLYLLKEFFPYKYFPKCILDKAKTVGAGQSAIINLMERTAHNSPLRNYFKVDDNNCSLTPDGRAFFENYLSKKEKESEKESLAFQHLKDSVEQIEKTLKDYSSDRTQKRWGFYFSIAAIIIAAISLLIQIFKK